MRTFALLLILVLLPSTIRAQQAASALPGFAATTAIKSIIGDLRDAANETIRGAQNAGNAVAFMAGMQLLLAIDSWEKANTNLINRTFGQLNDSQKVFFSNVQELMAQASEWSSVTLDRAEQITGGIATLLASSFVGSKTPVLTAVGPLFVEPAAPNDTEFVAVTFRGFALGYGGSELTVGSQPPIKKKADTDLRATFRVPRSALANDTARLAYVPMKLRLYKRVGGLFGLGARLEPVDYETTVVVLPNQLATYELLIRSGTNTRQVEQRSEFAAKNSKNSNYACDTYNYGVRSSERNIVGDPWIVSLSEDHGQHRIINKTQKGFQLEVCARGKKKWNRTHDGWSHVTVAWNEEYFVPGEVDERRTGQFVWHGQELLDLGPSVVKWELRVRTFDGRQYACNAPCQEPYFKVSASGAPSQLRVVPVVPSLAGR